MPAASAVQATEPRRYRITQLLGRGGFGMVYRARLEGPAGFEKDVAIKLLSDADPPAHVLSRFRDEARLLALCRDRGIVMVDPPIRLDGRWAVVMELVDGTSCDALLRERPLPPRIAAEIVEEVARTLDNLWNHPGPDGQPLHLVHRDIKPANIQLTPTGTVKILDFGVARARFAQRESMTSDHIGGTVGYIAPERLDGEDSGAGDVYSLGVTLHELVTGARPSGRSAVAEGTPDVRRVLELAARMRAPEPSARPSARQVERAARDLRNDMAGGDLRDWARGNVPRGPRHLADVRVGRTLTESLSDVLSPPTLPSGLRPRNRLALAGGLLIGVGFALGVVVLLAATVVWVYTWPTPPPDPVAPPAAIPQVPTPPTPLPAPTPAVPDSSRPPAPERPVAVAGNVVVEGDATSVQLVDASGGRHAPGAVPVGTYGLLADFGAGFVPAGSASVASQRTTVLRCVAAFQRCASQ